MTITYKTWTYRELADAAERLYREYDGSDSVEQAERLQIWVRLLMKDLTEGA